MLHERYTDISKLITNMDELQLTNGNEVIVYHEDKWYTEVVVCLESQIEKFNELKAFIAFVAQNLSKMDIIVQEYSEDNAFAYHFQIGYLYLDMPNRIRLEYWGMVENTEFEVVFEYTDGEFVLKKGYE